MFIKSQEDLVLLVFVLGRMLLVVSLRLATVLLLSIFQGMGKESLMLLHMYFFKGKVLLVLVQDQVLLVVFLKLATVLLLFTI